MFVFIIPQRGRSCLIYAIDRRQGDGYSHHMTEDKVDITLEAVQFLLDSGVDIAMRDDVSISTIYINKIA